MDKACKIRFSSLHNVGVSLVEFSFFIPVFEARAYHKVLQLLGGNLESFERAVNTLNVFESTLIMCRESLTVENP